MLCGKRKWGGIRDCLRVSREGYFEKMMSKLRWRRQGGASLTRATEVFMGKGNHWQRPRVGRLLSAIFLHFQHFLAFLFQGTLTTMDDFIFTCGAISFLVTPPWTAKFKGARAPGLFCSLSSSQDPKTASGSDILAESMNE